MAQKIRQRTRFTFPPGYGDNRIVILARDPWWIFAYWEIRRDDLSRYILRVYDVTDKKFTPASAGANSHFDIELNCPATNWYINVGSPDRSWAVDIGISDKDGKFRTLARSNIVRTPRYGMSDELDAEWMVPEDEYWKMFGLSGGFGAGKGSLEVREMFSKRLEEQISSAQISSMAIF